MRGPQEHPRMPSDTVKDFILKEVPMKKAMAYLIMILGMISFTGSSWAVVQSDAEALSVISAIDRNEIDASNYILAQNVDSKVMDYAKMMKQDHTDNLDQARALMKKLGLQLQKGASVMLLETEGATTLAALKLQGGGKLGQAYIKKMVKGHSDALRTIDTDLTPAVQNEDVKNFIAKTRTTVEKHLKEAQDLEKGFQKT